MEKRLKILLKVNEDKTSNRITLTRHIETLKKALDIAQVDYTFDKNDDFDIVHIFNYDQYKQFKSLKLSSEKRKVPVIMEAFVDQNDLQTTEKEEGNNTPSSLVLLKQDSLKAYNDADLVIVNHLSLKTMLRHEEVETRIAVIPNGVMNFDEPSEYEKKAFRSFYKLSDNDKIVIAIGNYDDFESVDTIANLARIAPDYEFFFYGIKDSTKNVSHFLRIASKVLNLHLVSLGHEELYRSMLYNANLCVISTDLRIESLVILEMMKNKIPVISIENNLLYDLLENDKTALIYKDFKNLYEKIQNIEKNNCIEEAYQYASKFSLKNYSDELLSVYKSLLNKSKK